MSVKGKVAVEIVVGIAKELDSKGIHVKVVYPGQIATESLDHFAKDQIQTNIVAGTSLCRESRTGEAID